MKKKLVDKMFDTPISYITLSPTLTVCTACNTKHVGEYYTCPNCKDSEHILIYSRIIGYCRPIVSGKIKIENNRIDGDENYWQDSRRVDWVERDKL
jgi:ribonucleoside-triphosphate reductase